MEWKNISELLGRATKIFQSNYLLKKTISDSVRQVVGVSIPSSDIVYKDGVVYVKAPPLIKSEIMLNSRHILDSIKKSGLTNVNVELK